MANGIFNYVYPLGIRLYPINLAFRHGFPTRTGTHSQTHPYTSNILIINLIVIGANQVCHFEFK